MSVKNELDKDDVASRPLVTLVIFAYNQEHLVRDAVQGAFSQTYSPLEIILSDDCSSDRTFTIMREMAESYQGPHTVRLNRNEVNLGLIGHANKAFSVSSGEIIVAAAGDDTSLPQRVELIVKRWLEAGGCAYAIASGYVRVDSAGSETTCAPAITGLSQGGVIANLDCPLRGTAGCAMAYRRELVQQWPISLAYVEDDALIRRALLLGPILYLKEPLVRYRWSDAGLSCFKNSKAWAASYYPRALSCWDQVLEDLGHPFVLAVRTPDEIQEVKAFAQKEILCLQQESLSYSDRFWERWIAFIALTPKDPKDVWIGRTIRLLPVSCWDRATQCVKGLVRRYKLARQAVGCEPGGFSRD